MVSNQRNADKNNEISFSIIKLSNVFLKIRFGFGMGIVRGGVEDIN